MNRLFAALALATLVASPGLAQSFDPHLGSGNIARPAQAQPRAFAHPYVLSAPFHGFASARRFAPGPSSASLLFERAKRTPNLY
jgi:hypothetical protein